MKLLLFSGEQLDYRPAQQPENNALGNTVSKRNKGNC